MKHPAPTSTLRKSSKPRAATAPGKNGGHSRYSNTGIAAPRIQEESNGNGASRPPFDLEERTAVFGEAILRFAKKIPRTPANDRLVGQLVGCGTSVGASYCEASEGVSKKNFRTAIDRCVKEAREAKYFLRLIAFTEPHLASEADVLYREAKELELIFVNILRQ